MTSRAIWTRLRQLVAANRSPASRVPERSQRSTGLRRMRAESLEDRSLLSAVPVQAENAMVQVPSASTYAHFVTVHAEIQSVPIVEIEPGDANSDGSVNFVDYQIFADNFLKEGTWADGDFNLDFVIDGADYVIWAEHFVITPAAAAPAAAPVPAKDPIPARAASVESTLDTSMLESLPDTADPANPIAEAVTVPGLETGVISSNCLGPNPTATSTPAVSPSATPAAESEALFNSDSLLPWASVAHDFQVASDEAADCLKSRTAKR